MSEIAALKLAFYFHLPVATYISDVKLEDPDSLYKLSGVWTFLGHRRSWRSCMGICATSLLLTDEQPQLEQKHPA